MGIHGHDKIFQTVLVKRGVKKFAQPDFSRIHFWSAVSYVYVSACCILVCICVFIRRPTAEAVIYKMD